MIPENIHVNTLLRTRGLDQKDTFLRVLHLDVTEEVAVIDVEDKNAFPEWWTFESLAERLESGTVERVEDDRFHADTRSDDAFSKSSWGVRNRRWEILQPTLSNPDLCEALLYRDTRSEIISGIHSESGTARDALYKWIRQFWQRGQTKNALLSNYKKSGRRGETRTPGKKKRGCPSDLSRVDPGTEGINVDEETRQLLVKGGRLYWSRAWKGRRLTKKQAYEKTTENFFRDRLKIQEDGLVVPVLKNQHERPTYDQFCYYVDLDLKHTSTVRGRMGTRRYMVKHRPVLGSSKHLSRGPGDLFQIDATLADIYLLSSRDLRQVIGRPVLYFVMDHWSRMITGFYAGLEGPSWQGAMMALENTFTEKVTFCDRYGVEIDEAEWPCSVYPRQITGDRGEMISKASDRLASAFSISVANTPAFRPDYKSLVEGQFKTVNVDSIRQQPGWVDKLEYREGPDYKLEAALDLVRFNELMILHIQNYNHTKRLREDIPPLYPTESDREPTPMDLWTWGIENGFGCGRVMDRNRVRASLLPTILARTGRTGLEVTSWGLHYDSASARSLGLFEGGSAKKSRELEVAYDARDISSVFLKREDGTFEQCPLTDRDRVEWSGKSLADVIGYKHNRKIAHARDRGRRDQEKAENSARIEALLADVMADRGQALGPRGKPTVTGIREARQSEKKSVRSLESFTRWRDEEDEPSQRDDDLEYVPPPS